MSLKKNGGPYNKKQQEELQLEEFIFIKYVKTIFITKIFLNTKKEFYLMDYLI